MNSFFNVLKREIVRISNSWVLLFSTLIGPLTVFLFIQYLFSAGTISNLPIAILDKDFTPSSRKIVQAIKSSPNLGEKMMVENMAETKQLLEKGKVEAIVFIDENAERDLLKGRQTNISVYINNTNLVAGSTIRSSLYKTISTVSAGVKLKSYLRTEKNEYLALNKLQPTRLNLHRLFNPFGNYAYFLALGLLPLLLCIFTLLGTVYALGIELKDGTAGDLMETANHSIFSALAGKVLPYTFLFFVQIAVMNLVLVKGMSTPLLGNIYRLMASQLVLILSYQTIALLLLGLTANLRLSLSLGSAYSIMALTFSGLTFPTMGMPKIAQLFSQVFPYVPGLKILLGETIRPESPVLFYKLMLTLSIFLLLIIPSVPLLKNKLSHEKYWGKQ